jgi:hypothetical protein
MPETLTERLVALTGLLSAVVLVLVALSMKTQPGAVDVVSPTAALPTATANSAPVDTTAETVVRRSTGSPARTALLVLTAPRGD